MDDLRPTHRGGYRQASICLRRYRRLTSESAAGTHRPARAGRALESSKAEEKTLSFRTGRKPGEEPAVCSHLTNHVHHHPTRRHAPLIRALGRRDLVLLFVVAVFNLNVVPSIAANGGVTIWLWIISLLLFFWPQGIAVIELAASLSGRRRSLPVGQRSFRRLPWISFRLVLLDQQHALRADGHALFRWRLGLRARPQPFGSRRQ